MKCLHENVLISYGDNFLLYAREAGETCVELLEPGDTLLFAREGAFSCSDEYGTEELYIPPNANGLVAAILTRCSDNCSRLTYVFATEDHIALVWR